MLMNYETSGQLPNGKFEAFGWWNCVSGYTLVDMHAVFVPGNEVFFHTSSLFFSCLCYLGWSVRCYFLEFPADDGMDFL